MQRINPRYDAGWVHEDICRRLEKFSDDVANGLSPRLMLLMPPRSGKQLADETTVPTPTGWTTHGALKAGDYVFHPDGSAIQVLATSEKTPSDVRVTLSNGEQVFCHENHEWTVYSRAKGGWRTISTKFLMSPGRAGKTRLGSKRSTYQLPTASALHYTGSEFTTHPYVLGAWLGDGSAGKPCITGAASDGAITTKIQNLGYPISTVCKHNTTGVLTTYFSGPRPNVSGRLTKELQSLGVYKDKHIPAAYQRMTVDLRLELLAGLIDTDGCADKHGRILFTAANRRLTDDVVELCEGLGFRPYVSEVQPRLSTSGIQGKKVYWTVGFQPTMRLPVALMRKQPRALAPQRRVGIIAVERVGGGRQGNCIQVDTPDGLYLVGRKLTATHNSELTSRSFPPWHLGRHPNHEIIACSYNVSLAMSFSKKVKEVLEDPAFHPVFDIRLNPNNQSAEEWSLDGTRGGYVAAGVGGGITGKGATILIIDDPLKNAEEADSADTREKLWDWYGSTAYTRLAPGGGVLCVQTFWHDDDLAGRLQVAMASDPLADQFVVVKYPAISESDEYLDYDSDLIVYEPPVNGKLLRLKNEALHPARYDLGKLNQIKRTISPRFWSALYQQNPVPDDGAYFLKEHFRRAPIPNIKRANVFIAWDFAISEKKLNDYTVGTVLLQDEDDVLHVAEQLRFKSGDGLFIVDAILNLAAKWNSPGLQLGFEDGQIYRAIESLLKKRMKERMQYPAVTVLKPISDKLARARPLQGRMQQGMVSFNSTGEWYDVCRLEMLRFPAGAHDDCVDSVSWATQMAIGRTPPQKPKSAAPPSWRNKVNSMLGGRGSFMSA